MGCTENQNVFEERKLEPQGYTVRPIFQVGCASTKGRSKLTKYFGRWISTILHHFSSASPVPPSLNIGSSINASRVFFLWARAVPILNTGVRGDRLQRVWTSGAGFCYSTVCRFQRLNNKSKTVPAMASTPRTNPCFNQVASTASMGCMIQSAGGKDIPPDDYTV